MLWTDGATRAASSAQVLEFWLGARPDDPATVAVKRGQWFSGGERLDAEIRERFEALLLAIVAAGAAAVPDDARQRLAAIIVLDQFSRNVYRGSARAFAQDALASEILAAGLARGEDARLGIIERAFFYLPFHHAEQLALQDRAVSLMAALRASAPAELAPIVRGFHEYAQEHREVIARFGRFPHRNAVLGRTATAEELGYLAAGAERYGQ